MRQKQRISNLTNLDSRKKLSKDLLHSDKSTYFYKSSFIIIPALTLLGILNFSLNPISSRVPVHAETITNNIDENSSIAFSISNRTDGTTTELGSNATISAEVTPGVISYIDNFINITTKNINRFYVTVQAVNNNSSLTGKTHGNKISPLPKAAMPGNDGSGFADNTWGYVLTADTSTVNNKLTYKPLSTYSTNPTVDYTSAEELADNNYKLKLTFAAKINANNPADHYQTQAMVSVVADAKEVNAYPNNHYPAPILMDQDQYINDSTVVISNTTSKLPTEDKILLNSAYEQLSNSTSMAEFLREVGLYKTVEAIGAEYSNWHNIDNLSCQSLFYVSLADSATKYLEETGSIELSLKFSDFTYSDQEVLLKQPIIILVFNGTDWNIPPSTLKDNTIVGTFTEVGAIVILRDI